MIGATQNVSECAGSGLGIRHTNFVALKTLLKLFVFFGPNSNEYKARNSHNRYPNTHV